MPDSPTVIRQIAWRELFPWLILLRTFRISISPALLALATIAYLVTPLGWSAGSFVFLTHDQRVARAAANEAIPRSENSQLAAMVPSAVRSYFPSASSAVLDAYFDLAEPLARFFHFRLTLGESAYYAFGFLWTIAVWAFPGGVITRKAIVQLATDNPEDFRSTAMYAGRRYLWYFLTPLYPALVIALIAIPISLLGLVLRVSLGFGALIAGLLWIFAVIASLVVMWLIGGLIFGWPLMWPTISAERDGDPFEAFSRSYSYVYGKPLHYFFYVVVAAAFGALCWAVVWGAAFLVQEFGFWALAWGGGGKAVGDLRQQAIDIVAREVDWRSDFTMWNIGATLIALYFVLIRAVASAFRFTFFFCTTSAIYLLLRHDVDEKEMDEIYIEPAAAGTSAQTSAAPIQED